MGNLLTGDLSVVDVVGCTEASGLAALERSAKSETIHTLSDFGLYRQPAGNSGFEIERKRLARS